MEFITEIFKRGNIEELIQFLKYGHESENLEEIEELKNQDYEKRVDNSYKKYQKVALKYANVGDSTKLSDAIDQLLTEHEEIYMEIGILIGYYISRKVEDKLTNLDSIFGQE